MRTLGSALTALALTLTLGGCNVTVGNSDRQAQRDAIADVVGDGELTLDLSSPPSRDDLALAEGRRTVILEREGGQPYDLTVVFGDGTRLATSVEWISVTAPDAESDPTQLVARRAGDDLDGVRVALDEAVADLGVDAGEADRVYGDVAGAGGGAADVQRSVTTSVSAPERLSIQPIGKANREEYVVNYTVEWGRS
ncbi:hypothetical protein [Nocardioides iriomotensis]|uniref:Uncharacterized protein n=1 Tax=Nocardioides iriomotensis TaxID=715784 RepID=A0A4Q5J8L7_9ACTN|nr:hypothetical protein [Nocardioides iriomotensis]RYU14209.1 hypothetical protein ETU37_04715 [Nocardioides iriomotensis]